MTWQLGVNDLLEAVRTTAVTFPVLQPGQEPHNPRVAHSLEPGVAPLHSAIPPPLPTHPCIRFLLPSHLMAPLVPTAASALAAAASPEVGPLVSHIELVTLAFDRSAATRLAAILNDRARAHAESPAASKFRAERQRPKAPVLVDLSARRQGSRPVPSVASHRNGGGGDVETPMQELLRKMDEMHMQIQGLALANQDMRDDIRDIKAQASLGAWGGGASTLASGLSSPREKAASTLGRTGTPSAATSAEAGDVSAGVDAGGAQLFAYRANGVPGVGLGYAV